MKQRLAWISIVLLTFGLYGCALFTTHYDALRHQNFTQLKAFHVKFLEDWTDGSEKTWSAAAVSEACDKGDLKFREASEYAKSKDNKDGTGARAVSIIWSEFKDNCKLAMSKKISKPASKELVGEISKNYQFAIDGELSRVGSPQ